MKSALTPSLTNLFKLELGFFSKKSSNLSALNPSKLIKRTGLFFLEVLATEETLTKYNNTRKLQ